MSERLYKNKYRTKSTRLASYKYSMPGYYFITICTDKHRHFFGNIKNDQMNLNDLGIIAHKYWMQIPEHFSGVQSCVHVIMPNHVHGILEIERPKLRDVLGTCKRVNACENINIPATRRDVACYVSTRLNKYKCSNNKISRLNKHNTYSNISPKSNSIPTIIRSYKSACTSEIRKNNPQFRWQPRYYDHIIRNRYSFNCIYWYIENNPRLWHRDRNNI